MTTRNVRIVRDAALSYAAKGWRVLPVHTVFEGCCSCGKDCKSKGKHPRIIQWQEKATTSKETINFWWGQQWPETNIGIATGTDSNIFVLDVDGPQGEATLQDLVGRQGPLPDTLTATTGKGKHFYFRHPSGPIKNSVGSLGACLDIRADGGYVVAPPSQHCSGKVYCWENEDKPVLEAPG